MFAIIGIIVVIGAILAGYRMEQGKMLVLMQPAELVIIGGAALGALLIANRMATILSIGKGMLAVFLPLRYGSAFYLENLIMLSDLFTYARKHGMVKLEMDVEEPEKSSVFTKYPKFLKDGPARAFVCDTLRMAISGGVGHMDLDQMIELDIEVKQHEAAEPVTALTSVADSLPGLGIVAAVLGVIITMGALGGPPEEIGHKVAAALVGTFLGVLLCYGFLGPLASNMAKINEADAQYFGFLRVGMMSFIKGSPPILCVEFARRSIPSHMRPTFQEMEKAVKAPRADGAAPVPDAEPGEAA